MLSDYQNIFIVGIKGVAMANLAHILMQMGKNVSGSDTDDRFITDEILEGDGIKVAPSFSKEDLPNDTDLVIYAASHLGRNNPQVVEAGFRGIAIMHQIDLISELMSLFKTTIAVAGCHGKTTTTSLLAYTLKQLTSEVSYLIGAPTFNGDNMGADFSGENYFVVEADEYGIDPPDNLTPKFHKLHPNYAIITNIDYDHPDVYPSIQHTKNAFSVFISNILNQDNIMPRLVICLDDLNIAELIRNIKRPLYITYGKSKKSDVVVYDIKTFKEGTCFKISSKIFKLKNYLLKVNMFGEKNVLNTTAVISLLLHLGFTIDRISQAIKGFMGAKRRFEYIGKSNKIVLYDDYAHHPAEIIATIQAARMGFPKKRIILLFQPHTYSRTESMKNEFIHSLSQADLSVILPIFASARENNANLDSVSNALEVAIKTLGIRNVVLAKSSEEALIYLGKTIQKEDMVITMGAGDVYLLSKKILEVA